MKKLLNVALILAMLPFFFLASCKKDEDDEVENKFEDLKTYLVQNNMDLDVVLTGWITDAAAVNAKGLSDYYFIDIRAEADFLAGHIEGAVNSTLATILDKAANAGGKQIVVACYTGQTAGHAVMALRLSGYADALVLKWGMCGWNKSLSDSWNNNTGNSAAGNANWAAAPGDIAPSVNYNKVPTITSTYDGVNLLNERVTAMLTSGFNGVNGTDVLASPATYCINNYWAATDVATYGNIVGAYRVQPFTLANGDHMYMNPDQQVVTYCWTGQTSSMITAYLKVIGYNSLSLKFGSNSMIYDDLQGHKWSEPTTDYPLVTK